MTLIKKNVEIDNDAKYSDTHFVANGSDTTAIPVDKLENIGVRILYEDIDADERYNITIYASGKTITLPMKDINEIKDMMFDLIDK